MENVLLPLALLACPVGMGLMMWFMSRGNRRPDGPAPASTVEDLHAEHARLQAEIDRRESASTDASDGASAAPRRG